MNSDVVITSARAEDAPDVVDVFNAARAQMSYLPVIHTATETMNFFSSLVNDRTVWVAEVGDTIVGFMELRDRWLNHLYILPEVQRRGIGKALLDESKRLSPHGLSLWVFEENQDAIRFYEREGFVLQEQRSVEHATNEEHLPDRRYSWRQ